jgi:hypothetical protein
MAKSTSLLFYPGLKYLNCNNSVNNVLEMLWTLLISFLEVKSCIARLNQIILMEENISYCKYYTYISSLYLCI